ncbi:myosin heavy chain IB-like [Symphalangus syndactylus]|uniref:myosin heavy chain IB-like n=1 Tax=Symphalangus syndactylus TaxID=9590 RepID=UPI0030065DBF
MGPVGATEPLACLWTRGRNRRGAGGAGASPAPLGSGPAPGPPPAPSGPGAGRGGGGAGAGPAPLRARTPGDLYPPAGRWREGRGSPGVAHVVGVPADTACRGRAPLCPRPALDRMDFRSMQGGAALQAGIAWKREENFRSHFYVPRLKSFRFSRIFK